MPTKFDAGWRIVNCIETTTSYFRGANRRIPALADPANALLVCAQSGARLAVGLMLAARGVPMWLFMGQEILEDKQWSDDINSRADLLILVGWASVRPAMRDHHSFCRDLIHMRRTLPTCEATRSMYRPAAPSIASWLSIGGSKGWRRLADGSQFAGANRLAYRIGFPSAGLWREVFNSDAYEGFWHLQAVATEEVSWPTPALDMMVCQRQRSQSTGEWIHYFCPLEGRPEPAGAGARLARHAASTRRHAAGDGAGHRPGHDVHPRGVRLQRCRNRGPAGARHGRHLKSVRGRPDPQAMTLPATRSTTQVSSG
jgi:hypothetical protein